MTCEGVPLEDVEWTLEVLSLFIELDPNGLSAPVAVRWHNDLPTGHLPVVAVRGLSNFDDREVRSLAVYRAGVERTLHDRRCLSSWTRLDSMRPTLCVDVWTCQLDTRCPLYSLFGSVEVLP